MEILDENKIASLLKDFTAGTDNDQISSEVRNILDAHKNNLTVQNVARGFPSIFGGSDLANWIKPLHFAHNLNEAISALSDLERLLEEQRSIVLAEMHLNYLDKVLADSHEAFQKQQQLKSILNLKTELSLAHLRAVQKQIDLIEYCKAVELAGRLLYGIEARDDFEENLNFLIKARTWLREVLLNYREKEKLAREVIYPVSLKYMKNNNGDFVLDYWRQDGEGLERIGEERGMRDEMPLIFDLKNTALNKFNSAKIKRIGLRVIDTADRDTNPSERKITPNIWNATMRDHANGFPLGDLDTSPRQEIHDLEFSNIQGSSSEITWVSNSSLINIKPDRTWSININGSQKAKFSPTPHPVQHATSGKILDIIIFFHFDYFNVNR